MSSEDEWNRSSDEEIDKKPATTKVKKKGKWEDEDAESDEPKDDWDASDDDEVEELSKPKPAAPKPIRQKGITKQKIAKREAEEALLAEQEARAAAEASNPALQKRREQQAQIAADLENAKSLFGDMALSQTETILNSNPTSRAEFDSLASQLTSAIVDKNSGKAYYGYFAEQLIRSLCQPLKDVECRKVASQITAIANEKQAQAKGAVKKKGAVKTAKPTANFKKGGFDEIDSRSADLELDDDDFM